MMNFYCEAARNGAFCIETIQSSFVHWLKATAKKGVLKAFHAIMNDLHVNVDFN